MQHRRQSNFNHLLQSSSFVQYTKNGRVLTCATMSRYCPTTVITAERERDIETMMSRRFLSGTLPPSFSSFGNDHFPGNDRLRASARCAGATNQGHKGSFFTDKSPEEKAPNYCVCLLARPRVRRLSLAVNSVMRFDTAMTCTSINDSAGRGGRAGGDRTGAGAGAVGGGSETNIPPLFIYPSYLVSRFLCDCKAKQAGIFLFGHLVAPLDMKVRTCASISKVIQVIW